MLSPTFAANSDLSLAGAREAELTSAGADCALHFVPNETLASAAIVQPALADCMTVDTPGQRRVASAAAGGPHPPFAFVLAAALCVLGVLAALLLDPWLMGRATFIFLVPAVIVGSVYGGRTIGLVSILLGALSGLLAEKLTGVLVSDSVYAAAAYVAVAIPLALGGSSFRRGRHRENAYAAELARREALLSSLLETVPDAMVVIDEGGAIRDFSPNAERQFGWGVGEVIGEDVGMLMPEQFRAAHLDCMKRYIHTGERSLGGLGREVVALRKDGTTFPADLAIGELDLPEGRFFTGFLRDITGRQRSEAQLQELQSELMHVSRLTALGEMATALAHELNQPLSAIGNYLLGSKALLRREQVPHERVAEAVDRAAHEALRAGEIIRRIREFVSRSETERWPQSLPRLIQDTAALALVEVKDRGVEIRYRFEPGVEWVMVDKIQVQQVLLNLIRNATDAVRDMPIRVIDIAIEPGAPDFAQVTVSDTGPGIDAVVLRDLFHPFITTKQAGLGVGLSICRTIIEGHGGQVHGQNNPGGGAVFTITLPIAADKEAFDRA